MSIGKRITTLRTKLGLTQQQLADRLFVTDKAVSKWEREGGEPNTQALIEMAKIFEVSVDYLLTGIENEKIVIMSITEKIAIDDNVDDFKKVLFSELNRSDEKGTTILEYIYKHKSKKIFDYYIRTHEGRLLLGGHYDQQKHIDNFIIMCFETNNTDKISDSNHRAIIKISQVYFEDQQKPRNNYQQTYTVKNNLVDYILSNNKVVEFIMSQGDIYWSNAIIKVLEVMIKNKDPHVEQILSFVENKNKAAIDFHKGQYNSYYQSNDYWVMEDGVYERNNHKLVKTITRFTRQAVLNALEINDYELAERINIQAGNVVTEHDFKMDKVTKNDSLSKDDKAVESVMFGGIVDIDKLIALDNYKLYKQTIINPASKIEYALTLAKNRNIKELLQFAVQEQMNNTIEAIRKDRIESLEQSIRNDSPGKHDKINSKYLEVQRHLRRQQPYGKDMVLFEDIISHKDINFFKHACKTDPDKIDWALEEVVKKRSSEHGLIQLLLDEGAKLHKRWTEDDGEDSWERDEIDEVSTQLLRNQTEIFLKEKIKNDK